MEVTFPERRPKARPDLAHFSMRWKVVGDGPVPSVCDAVKVFRSSTCEVLEVCVTSVQPEGDGQWVADFVNIPKIPSARN